MDKPLVSVLICVYHAAELLPSCIKKLLKQTYGNIEIVLLQNGDASDKAACDDIVKKYPNTVVYNAEESISIGVARNLVISRAKGEYFMFLDADDELADDHVIEDMVNDILRCDADVLVANYDRKMGGERISARPHGFTSATDTRTADFRFRAFYSGGHLAYLWGKLYRSAYIRENGILTPDVSYGEDKGFSFCLYMSGPKYAFTDRTAYIYTQNTSSASMVYRKDYRTNWVGVAKHFDEYKRSHGIGDKYADLKDFVILFSLIFHAKQEYEAGEYKKVKKSVIREYRDDEYCKACFSEIRDKKLYKGIAAISYKYGIKALDTLFLWRFDGLLCALFNMLFALGVDKKHSSTGK